MQEACSSSSKARRHPPNHVNVAYAPNAETADRALAAQAAMLNQLGVEVHFCGV